MTTISSLINFCRGYDIQQFQRFPEEDVQFYASHYYYGRLALTTIIACSTIGVVSAYSQKFFKPLSFITSSVAIGGKIFRHLKSYPKEIIPLEEYEKRLKSEEDDGLKKAKLHVIQIIKTFFPPEKLPRISFSSNNSSWLAGAYAITISKEDLKKSTDALEHVVAHEIGHCYNADDNWSIVFHIFSDFVKFFSFYTNNIPLMILVSALSLPAFGLFKSFREKEADRFAITKLNSGAKKAVLSLKEEVGLESMWTGRGYNAQETIFLNAAISDKGIIGAHPTEYQRITWAMQQLKHPEIKTNFFNEFYRFFSTPFYGDLQLLKESKNIKSYE